MKKSISLFKASSFLVIILMILSFTREVNNFEYRSEYYRIQVIDSVPFIKFFSVDASGKSKLDHNIIQWTQKENDGRYQLYKISASHIKILRDGETEWDLTFERRNFSIISNYTFGNNKQGIEFRFGKNKNHATLLGIMDGKLKTRLPAVLHLPDLGSFLIKADKPATVDYDASRKNGENFISVSLPSATAVQTQLSYNFNVTSIYPQFEGVGQEKYEGFRKNYLNLFQVNPRLQVLANNSCSDPCAFTLFLSSMLALKTPQLADSLSALDLLRMSVERYLNGMKAYGMYGYNGSWEDGNATLDNSSSQPYDYLDTYPSLVISACNYIIGSNDLEWSGKYYPVIKAWMDRQMSRDYNKNGLVEYELSGNSGSWNGIQRPANWWDTIGFGFEDAFSNAITFNALNLMIRIAEMNGAKDDADHYRTLANKMKNAYFQTFYNPKTGVLAGWKSRDGKLHDYYFVMVNGMAVYYDLVPPDKMKSLLLAIWNKMKEVGYTDFSLGLPGNLVSVRKEDYTHHDPRWGGGEKEDGSDAFQRYENGGASLNWTYFTLEAFRKAGLEQQYQEMADGIMKGIDEGSFQGQCSTGSMTKDWKTWTGECWGYEGFLCDGYLVMLAFNPMDE